MSIRRAAPRQERHGGAQVLRLPRELDLDAGGLQERIGDLERGRPILPAMILNTTSIWIRQGIGLVQRQRGGVAATHVGRGAFS